MVFNSITPSIGAGLLKLQRDPTTVPSPVVNQLNINEKGQIVWDNPNNEETHIIRVGDKEYLVPKSIGSIMVLPDHNDPSLTLQGQNPPLVLQANTTPVSSPDGGPVTKPAPVGLGGYTSRSGRHYTDDELKKWFMPTYKWPPKPPEPATPPSTNSDKEEKPDRSRRLDDRERKRAAAKARVARNRSRRYGSGNQPNARGDSYASSRSRSSRSSRSSRRTASGSKRGAFSS